jgi:hypothetical protein
MFLFYSSLIELVVDIDSYPDQYIQWINNTTITYKLVFNILLKAASEYSYKCIIILISDKSILLELDYVFRGRGFLA